jgi:predicted metalloenzyme YecM
MEIKTTEVDILMSGNTLPLEIYHYIDHILFNIHTREHKEKWKRTLLQMKVVRKHKLYTKIQGLLNSINKLNVV